MTDTQQLLHKASLYGMPSKDAISFSNQTNIKDIVDLVNQHNVKPPKISLSYAT